MSSRPVILCPVDFSDASRSALRLGHTLAERFGAGLLILTVEDALLAEETELATGVAWTSEECRRTLTRFVEKTLGDGVRQQHVQYHVGIGKPAHEILRVAREQHCDLIVMSTRGVTGMRKLFFGATTERVLRETAVPVLVAPPSAAAPAHGDRLRGLVRRLVVPVDLSSSSIAQVQIARTIAEAVGVPLLLTHVVEPVRGAVQPKLHVPSLELERKTRAEDALHELLATVPRRMPAEALVAYGDPAEEIVKVAHDRDAGLIVVGLQGSPAPGPRMGSVTYRVLCLGRTLVLALPPHAARRWAERRAGVGVAAS